MLVHQNQLGSIALPEIVQRVARATVSSLYGFVIVEILDAMIKAKRVLRTTRFARDGVTLAIAEVDKMAIVYYVQCAVMWGIDNIPIAVGPSAAESRVCEVEQPRKLMLPVVHTSGTKSGDIEG
ncbi:hypothetical protein LTR17_011392 [Elasticomyces elasticus]|nr:hypothetical protein LTR17_011392 [Elasticomyces elasticus]